MSDMNARVMKEFRENQGKVGGFFDGIALLILHHTGAQTGAQYEIPLAFLPDGERMVIVASNGGADAHPQWYHNLVARPDVKVEIGSGEIIDAKAVVTEGEESVRLYDALAELVPPFADYREKTDRQIPVIALEPA